MFISFYNSICYVLPPFTYFTVKYCLYVRFFMLLYFYNVFEWCPTSTFGCQQMAGWHHYFITSLNRKPQISFARNKWQEKIQVFWDLMPCWLVSIYRRFGVVFHLKLQGLTVSQTLLTIYQSAWHHIPQEWNLHQHCCENLKSWTSGQSVFSGTIMYAFSAKVANVLNAAWVEEQIM